MSAAAQDQLEIFGNLSHEKSDTRCIGMIGAAEQLDKEMEVLHRTARVTSSELMEIEADQKHVLQLSEDLGLTKSNNVKTPRRNQSACDAERIEDSPFFDGKQTTTFRSGTMRCAYLVQDRVDISESIQCLARAMSKPRAGHMTQLKRAARYMKGVPRTPLQYSAQDPSEAHLEVHVDSDWAGTTVTRRSTSGSDRPQRSTCAQTHFNISKRDWTQWCGKRVLRTHEGRMIRTFSGKLVCRLEPEATTVHFTQTLQARRQLHREEELARTLVTCRR